MTGWMGENNFRSLPIAMYGVILFLAALAYSLLVRAILLSFFVSWAAFLLYVTVAVIWFIPDRRIEKVLEK